MGTSRRRTPPAPVSTEPRKALGPLVAATKKLANRFLVSREKRPNFCRRANPWLPYPEVTYSSWETNEGRRKNSTALAETCRGAGSGNILTAFRLNALPRTVRHPNAAIPCRPVHRPGEAFPMFCREVLSFKKSQCSITRRWLSTRKGRTLGSPSMRATRAGGRTLVSKSDIIEIRIMAVGGCDLRNRSEIASRQSY